MAEPARRLQVVHVDPDGEEVACPGCADRDVQIDMMERELQGKRLRIGALEAEAVSSAHRHQLWPRATRLFDIWRRATNHTRAEWNAERFNACVPALKKLDDATIERAIAGIAFDPYTDTGKNGREVRHDWWHTLFKSVENVQRYANKAPRDFKPTVPRDPDQRSREIARDAVEHVRMIEETDDHMALARYLVAAAGAVMENFNREQAIEAKGTT